MSIESLTIVLNHSRARGTDKLVLIGIANHDGDGGAYPSIDTLARYANVTRRNVQAATLRLAELGELEVVVNGGGDRDCPGGIRPNLYRILVTCPGRGDECDGTPQHRKPRPAKPGPAGASVATPLTRVGSDTPTGVGSDTSPVSAATPKPSSNQDTPPSPASGGDLDQAPSCPRHPTTPGPNCRKCGTTARAAEAAQARAAAERRRRANAEAIAADRAAAAAAAPPPANLRQLAGIGRGR